jgi:hypothetical protein
MPRPKLFVALALVLATGVEAAAQTASATREASRTVPATSAPVQPARPTVLPGTPSAAFATIHVSAVSATNTALPGRLVRLRDARNGRLVAANTTDEAGTFTFRDVDPGSYIIELLAGNQSVQATSALLSVDAGAVVFAVVRLPSRLEPAAGFFDRGVARAGAVIAAAAAAGVLAVQSTTDVSPR